MNRRNLFKGFSGLTAGLVLPPTLIENTESARRFWALDQTMMRSPHSVFYDMGRQVVESYTEGFLDANSLAYAMSGIFGQPTIIDLGGSPNAYQLNWTGMTTSVLSVGDGRKRRASLT